MPTFYGVHFQVDTVFRGFPNIFTEAHTFGLLTHFSFDLNFVPLTRFQ